MIIMILLLTLALMLLCLSLSNQPLLPRPLGKVWRYSAWLLLGSSALAAAQSVVALLVWLVSVMVLLMLIPALAFWLRYSLRSIK